MVHDSCIGPKNAPMTIVEFFDPACETCRAFYPLIKRLMAQYPSEVRLVIRYAPLHQGSDQVIKLLEGATLQGKYEQVLKAVLAAQPVWANDDNPKPKMILRLRSGRG